jgi:hypothetical protein
LVNEVLLPRRKNMRLPLAILFSLMVSLPCGATILEKLSTERLIDESTEIVRGTVNHCSPLYKAPVIYTVCEISVSERLKGPEAAKVTVMVPGGTTVGLRQVYAAAPTLEAGREHVFFIWQGKSGNKQLMGLCQGLMNLGKDAKGNVVVLRAKVDERMVNAKGEAVEDAGFRMPLQELKQTVQLRVGGKVSGARQ